MHVVTVLAEHVIVTSKAFVELLKYLVKLSNLMNMEGKKVCDTNIFWCW
jgi:hypothetical protein